MQVSLPRKAVLKTLLAKVMKEGCRATDIAARFGGDEFAVLLIHADREMSKQAAYRISDALQQLPDEPLLSVSICAAMYPDDGSTTAELWELADRRLYRSKRSAECRQATNQCLCSLTSCPAPHGSGAGMA